MSDVDAGSTTYRDILRTMVSLLILALALLVVVVYLATKPKPTVVKAAKATVQSVSGGDEVGTCEEKWGQRADGRGGSRPSSSLRYKCDLVLNFDGEVVNYTIESGRQYQTGDEFTLYRMEGGDFTHKNPNGWRVVIPILASVGAALAGLSILRIAHCVMYPSSCGASSR